MLDRGGEGCTVTSYFLTASGQAGGHTARTLAGEQTDASAPHQPLLGLHHLVVRRLQLAHDLDVLDVDARPLGQVLRACGGGRECVYMMQMQQQWLALGWGRAPGWGVLGGVQARRRRTVDGAWEDMCMCRTPTPLAPARGPPGSPPPAGRAAPSCLPSRGCRRSCGVWGTATGSERAFAGICVRAARVHSSSPPQLTRSPWLLLLLLIAFGGGGGAATATAARVSGRAASLSPWHAPTAPSPLPAAATPPCSRGGAAWAVGAACSPFSSSDEG